MCDVENKTEENDKKIHLRLQSLDKKRVEDDRKLVRELDENRLSQKDKRHTSVYWRCVPAYTRELLCCFVAMSDGRLRSRIRTLGASETACLAFYV